MEVLFRLFLLLAALHSLKGQAWKEMHEYEYEINVRTVTGREGKNEKFAGNLIQGKLVMQRQPLPLEDVVILAAKVNELNYANLQENLYSWDANIENQKLNWTAVSTTKKPFKITLHDGRITSMVVNKIVPNWEANLYKALISQFQINTNGTHLISSTMNQLPNCTTYGTFRVMEDTITGNVDTLYEIRPLTDSILQNEPFIDKFPNIESKNFIEVLKTKNYSNYKELPLYHYGFSSSMGRFDPGTNQMGNFFLRTSNSRIIISGNLKEYSIYSTTTINKIITKPTFNKNDKVIVAAMVNATLLKTPIEVESIMQVINPVNIGNLVYTYDRPFDVNNLVKASKKPESNDDSKDNHSKKSISLNRPKRSYEIESKRFTRNVEDVQLSYEENSDSILDNSKKPTKSSSSNSASSSSYSAPSLSSEQDSFAEEVSLDQAPNVPFLPHFTGYQGQSIKLQLQNPSIKMFAINLAKEIAKMYDNDKHFEKAALIKYTELISLLQIMNYNEMQVLIDNLYTNEINGEKYLIYKVCLDAIAETGTGPAVLVVRKLIETGQLTSSQIGEILNSIIASVKHPTYQHVFQLFSLLKMPQVISNSFTYASAHIGYANLLREVYFNKRSTHSNYPTHIFGTFRTKQARIFAVKIYLPFIIHRLENAIHTKDDIKVLIYIKTLGNLGHQRILRAFEPYLEGTKPCSAFKRLLMVTALEKLCEIKPKTARSVLFKILQNPGENIEVRIAAFYNIMKANPPISLLEQIIEQANNSNTPKQLRSAIKTGIKSAAKLESHEFTSLSLNARAVESLLIDDEKDNGIQYSANHLFDYINKNLDVILQSNLATIGSHEFYWPSLKLMLNGIFAGSKFPLLDLNYMISSIPALQKFYYKLDQKHEEIVKLQKMTAGNLKTEWDAEEVLKKLRIRNKIVPDLQGIFSYKLGRIEKMFPFTNQSLHEMLTDFGKENTARNLFNSTKTENMYSMTLAFPTESSLTFLWTVDIPIGIQFNTNLNNTKTEKLLTMNGKIFASFQSKSSIVFQSNSTVYSCGINKDLYVNLPNITFSMKTEDYKLNVNQNDNILFKYTSIPYISKQDITKLSNTNLIFLTKHLDQTEFINTFGPIELHFIGDKFNNKNFDIINGMNYANLTIYTKSVFTNASINLKFVRKHFESRKNGVVNKVALKQLSKLNVNTANERLKIMSDLIERSLNGSNSKIGDIFATYTTEKNMIKYAVTLAMADNEFEKKSQYLLYASDCNNKNTKFQFGATALSYFPKLNDLQFELIEKIRANFSLEMGFGKNYLVNNKIRAIVDWYKTDSRNQYIKKLANLNKCGKIWRKENLIECQRILQESFLLNSAKILFEYENLDNYLVELLNTKHKYLKNLNLHESGRHKKENTKKIDVDLILNDKLNQLSTNLLIDRRSISLEDVTINDWQRTLLTVHPHHQLFSRLNNNLYKWDGFKPTCFITENVIKTFDGKVYDGNLNFKHSYPLLVYIPKYAKDFTEQKEQISVVIKSSSSFTKDVMISIRNIDTRHKLLTWDIKAVNTSFGQAAIKANIFENYGGQHKKLDFTNKYSASFGNILEAYTLNDGTLKVILKKNFEITYDGNLTNLKLLNFKKFYGSIKGLCGNFDGEFYNDFETPKNCLARTANIFIKSNDLSIVNTSKMSRFDCVFEKSMYLDVISNRDTDRVSEQHDNLSNCVGHSTITEENAICTGEKYIIETNPNNNVTCYSMKKIPFCNPDCQPVKFVQKLIPFWCTRNIEDSEYISRNIAKYRFLSVTPSERINMTIPFGCVRDDNVNPNIKKGTL